MGVVTKGQAVGHLYNGEMECKQEELSCEAAMPTEVSEGGGGHTELETRLRKQLSEHKDCILFTNKHHTISLEERWRTNQTTFEDAVRKTLAHADHGGQVSWTHYDEEFVW